MATLDSQPNLVGLKSVGKKCHLQRVQTKLLAFHPFHSLVVQHQVGKQNDDQVHHSLQEMGRLADKTAGDSTLVGKRRLGCYPLGSEYMRIYQQERSLAHCEPDG